MSKRVNLQKVFEMYKDGCSFSQITKETGHSRTTVLKHLKLRGLWTKKLSYDDEIIRRYLSGQSQNSIAKEMNICRNTVSYRLKLNNIERRTNQVNPEDVVELYAEGFLVNEVAEMLGCSTATVTAKLDLANVKKENHLIKLDNDDVYSTYQKNRSLVRTAAHFNVDTTVIRKILSQYGITQFRKIWDKENDGQLISLYKGGMSSTRLAKKFDMTHSGIVKQLKRLNIDRRPRGQFRRGSGFLAISDSLFTRIKGGAKVRNLNFDLNKDLIYQMLVDQDYCCKLSGVQITLPGSSNDFSTGNFTASLDRIDSSKGYTHDNVQWVHKFVNIMKQDMSDQEFISWCGTISDHNRDLLRQVEADAD